MLAFPVAILRFHLVDQRVSEIEAHPGDTVRFAMRVKVDSLFDREYNATDPNLFF